MRTIAPILAALALLGCSSTPSEAASSAGPAPGAAADSGGLFEPKAPAFGPGAGAIFGMERIQREPNGGLQVLSSWRAGTRAAVSQGDCGTDSLPIEKGAVFVICTLKPVGGPKTGWTKVEITGKKGNGYPFRYVHWPSVGAEELTGTGVWTPDGEASSLTYTHGAAISGTTGPEPSGPALTEPEPDGPALTEPVPDGPALTEPVPDGPALTEPEPDGPAEKHELTGPALRKQPPGETGERPDGEGPEPPPEDAPSPEVTTPALPPEAEPSPPPKNEPLAPEPTEEAPESPGTEDEPTGAE